ncbi:glycoside hydrolase family 65 protein [Planomonospora parontospora]|uniref:glycoside hydrolase family 65 protein n=1 Tax=Planomonospora parontospora TaxID=58119 RepID=UPI00167011FD|nr:glycoside hydrolase family 65 protein [Planomonospora parontospora]GGL58017.1 trehalose 6-phosphate phosphorylase [Planomonospora parontospora subsp. antibiotica]GII19892.1 trehalose 6-phosphate phosphorylase [Planomonospora parontospora subsp. antibiotica]
MDPWLLTYDGVDPALEGLREALTTLGNGYLATRGAACEAHADGVRYPGTYLAGCYNRLTSQVAGRSVDNEDLVNAPNWLPLTFRADGGDWFAPGSAEILACHRRLDLRRGVLTWMLRVRDGAGRTTGVQQHRLVSMDDPHLAALAVTITPEDWSGLLEVRSALDSRVVNAGVARYRGLANRHLIPITAHACGDVIEVLARTAASRVEIALAARTVVAGGRRRTHAEQGWVADDHAVRARAGDGIRVEKVVAVYTSRDRAIASASDAARTAAIRAEGFDALLERHTRAWERLWSRAQVTSEDTEVQQTLNLYAFHLLQTLSPHVAELDAGLPARGLHGEAYRGHVFWDELFVFPYLAPRFPQITEALLRYRWRRLPEARWAARAAGHAGAMFPWQSGSDGREETPTLHFNPRSGRWLADNSHLQRHVGLAVAFNVWQHHVAAKDPRFLAGFGGELLLEIARCFASLAVREGDRYAIRGVMGPDEYHDGYVGRAEPGVDNNAYTNVMTAWLMRRVLETVDLVGADRASTRERERFADMAERMRVDFHDGVISQFEGYGDLAELDWDGYRRAYGDIRRLDRILEAEGDTPNRYKASKQADVLMLFHLLGEDGVAKILTGLGYAWDAGAAARTVDYYLARTCHGSTLSAVVHAGVLARVRPGASEPFLVEALNSDVRDVQGGTTAEGIHLGAMAGVLSLFTPPARPDGP